MGEREKSVGERCPMSWSSADGGGRWRLPFEAGQPCCVCCARFPLESCCCQANGHPTAQHLLLFKSDLLNTFVLFPPSLPADHHGLLAVLQEDRGDYTFETAPVDQLTALRSQLNDLIAAARERKMQVAKEYCLLAKWHEETWSASGANSSGSGKGSKWRALHELGRICIAAWTTNQDHPAGWIPVSHASQLHMFAYAFTFTFIRVLAIMY